MTTVYRFAEQDKTFMQRVATFLVKSAQVALILAAAIIQMSDMDDVEIRIREDESSLYAPALGDGGAA